MSKPTMYKQVINGTTYIIFSDREKVVFSQRIWNKSLKTHARELNLNSDEMKGLSQAKPNEVFNYSIIKN